MIRILTVLTILFSGFHSYGQTEIETDIIEKIDIGYSTRWDVEQLFGKGEYVDNSFLNPNDEQDHGKKSHVHSNVLKYKDKGITFVCADDGEKISSIYLTSPFILKLNQQNIIKLGETSLGNAFGLIDTLKANTTGASNYWSFSVGKYEFFVAKPIEDRNKIHFSEVPTFKDKSEFYKNQPVSIVTIDLRDYEFYEQDFREIENNLYCNIPLYAPKTETHKNCFDMGWPDNVPAIMRPLYALTGGQKSEKIKQGYWKEYRPSHKLSYEGEFKDNKEVGIFKYYDTEGKLERTENFSESNFNWTIMALIGLVLALLTVVIMKRRRKNAA